MPDRSPPQSRWNDEAMEIAIGHLLRIGVSASALLVFLGGLLYLLQEHDARPDYTTFHGVRAPLSQTVAEVFRGTMAGHGGSVVRLGLLLLIATPVARVVLAGVGFLLQRDRLYVAVSGIVLAILLYSLAFGK